MKIRAAALLLFVAPAGSGRGPRAVGNPNKRSQFEGWGGRYGSADAGAAADPVLATPHAAGKKARVLAHASARALATNATHVFYGDAEDDTLYALPKKGGDAVRFARRAP